MSNGPRQRVAILISGRGSNMEALIEAANVPDFPAEIVGVISNRTDALGLQTARDAHIATATFPLKDFADKQASDLAISDQLKRWQVDIVCLAGFMRILSPAFSKRWAQRVINMHPALLPKHKGLDTHQRALDAGDTVHGCTVHLMVEELDAGPIILQEQLPIAPNDTAETLAKRVLALEHATYPKALAMFAAQQISGEKIKT